jgi:predicted ATP-dependent endonuclease of OLD family
MNFYQKLNYLVRKYVNLMVIPSFHDDEISLHFVDKWNNYYTLAELSSGEQAFLAIIFTLRGYGLMDGLLIIDEPEQHLHPQMQEKMLEMIQDIAEKYRLQVIMSTHSPLMIDASTINAVHRCTTQESGTMVWSSTRSQFADDEYRLIQMLQYDYTAKVFFVDTIIMVEGETDEYFFDYYLRWLRTQPGWSHKIRNFAVINVNGKG